MNFKRSKQTKTKTGYIKEMSVYETESCKGCPHREQCINKKEKEIKTIEISWKFTAQREASRARITSPKGIMLRINRSIQSEGAFGVLKEDRHFRRLKRRGKEGVFEEILLYAFSFNILKLHAKRQNNRLKSMLFYENTA